MRVKIPIGLIVVTAALSVVLAGCGGRSSIRWKAGDGRTDGAARAEGAYAALQENVPAAAARYIGKSYKYGADPDTSNSSDCSHLVSAVTRNSLKDAGYELEPYYMTTDDIYDNSFQIDEPEARPGDIVFFTNAKGAEKGEGNHAGVVTKRVKGALYFIHASSSKGTIETSTRSDTWEYYWREKFDSFRRWKEEVFNGGR
jgi:cell wall-associated NlpC family hydrolase